MTKDYQYIKQQIARSKGAFQLDCCKVATELFWQKHGKDTKSHDMYQNLLGFILLKL